MIYQCFPDLQYVVSNEPFNQNYWFYYYLINFNRLKLTQNIDISTNTFVALKFVTKSANKFF